VLALPLSFAPYLLAFGLWYPDQLTVDLLQGASAALACALVRAAIGLVRRPRWPEGRFLYTWGYAEIAHDVLRVVPIDELAIEARGATLGRVRVILRATDFRTTLWLAASELGGLERALEIRGDADAERWTLGYRDAPPRIEGRRVGRRLSRGIREASWALAAATVGVALAHFVWLAVPTPPPVIAAPAPVYENADGLRPAFAAELIGRTDVSHVDVDFGGCSSERVVIQTIESYLTLGLARPLLGPARPGELPLPRRAQSPTRIRSLCSWEVDRTHGTLSHAEARVRLEHHGEPLIEHVVRVDTNDVLSAITRCGLARSFDLSPRTLAVVSSTLLRSAVAYDAFVDPEDALASRGASRASSGCLGEVARGLEIVAVR